jgi:diadenosine tetraphosphatase ApaH/serine/threonine PP2A family protein phosphatase
LQSPAWGHLAPLKGLKPLYRELREPRHRIRKAGLERLKDGSVAANPQRMGPLTFAARLMGLDRVLAIQAECNAGAIELGRPLLDILNGEEEARIRQLIAAETWPNGWDGDEPAADTPMDGVDEDRSLAQQDWEDLLWKRFPPDYSGHFWGKHLVHGHTPSRHNPETFGNRTNVDSGCVFGGKLSCAVFDDSKAGGPIDFIEVAA